MSRIQIPSKTRLLPSTQRVSPTSPSLPKLLSKLPRQSLISLALDWLSEENLPLCPPFLSSTSDYDSDDGSSDFYPPLPTVEALRQEYHSLLSQKGSKKDIIDRILKGDWRKGLTLYQVAMVDLQVLYESASSVSWSAYRIAPLTASADDEEKEEEVVDKESLRIPRFHPSSFLRALQGEILSDMKVHFTFDRHKALPLLILRVFLLDSPYGNTGTSSKEATMGKVVFVSFPDGSPHIFISKASTFTLAAAATIASNGGQARGAGESKSLRTLLVEGIPKALSRPRERVTLLSTNLTTKNLEGMVHRKGGGRQNFAGGGWGGYADEKRKESPLDTVMPKTAEEEGSETETEGRQKRERGHIIGRAEREEEQARRRAKKVAKARFGDTGKMGDGKGVERVDIVLEDPFKGPRRGNPKGGGDKGADGDGDVEMGDGDDSGNGEGEGEDDFRPNVRLTFHGSHVFAGIRQFVEAGIIDGEKMPGWMTDEEGVTVGAVRHGRIRGNKGSGV
ncbi:centromere protein Chl4/mis15/CENP-N [Podospora australis]|uniref:Centromere protein Chl4/mis15/CENP-N n=1 Tax=Podospora australis TaxID=1536484 RepID=A0AAN6WVD6_9PEZI|nr:centromere protein Chl4/mis15/CENP-N [Podospora australis]